MINVTKTYLPDKEKYLNYIDEIYKNGWLTNNGPMVISLQRKLEEFLGVKNLLLVTNATLALQVAYKLLQLKNEVITTPFSFVATSSSLVWEGLTPVYSDINAKSFNLDPKLIKKHISNRTSAILATHVFGNACEVDGIASIAKENDLKVIYDAAHAFGVDYKGKSLLSYGDISIISFHATKLFHTIEGGALIINDDTLYEEAKLMINFGIDGPDSVKSLGINAKMNEFQAAMGLAVLDDIPAIIHNREKISKRYREELLDHGVFQEQNPDGTENYSYFPLLFDSEQKLLDIQKKLNSNQIFPRRYFYPSLDELPYNESNDIMPISRDIARRILCLPIYQDLDFDDQTSIIDIIKKGA
jgi:dTDP-4-amino-4,6-dideoxygalactose transaminase